MKNILIIGSEGQLGEELKKILFSEFNIICSTRKILDISNIEHLERNLNLNNIDILINCAAFHNLIECEKRPVEALKCNVLAQEIIIEKCKKFDVKYICFSTDYVFNGESKYPYSTNSLTSPLQVYGISRLLGEKVVLNSGSDNFVIIRTSGLFGLKESKTRGKNFIEKCLDQINQRGFVEVAQENRFSPTYAPDLAKSIKKIIFRSEIKGLLHLTNSGSASWYELAKYAATHIGLEDKVKGINRNSKTGEMMRPKFTVLEHSYKSFPILKMPSWRDAVDRYMYSRK